MMSIDLFRKRRQSGERRLPDVTPMTFALKNDFTTLARPASVSPLRKASSGACVRSAVSFKAL